MTTRIEAEAGWAAVNIKRWLVFFFFGKPWKIGQYLAFLDIRNIDEVAITPGCDKKTISIRRKGKVGKVGKVEGGFTEAGIKGVIEGIFEPKIWFFENQIREGELRSSSVTHLVSQFEDQTTGGWLYLNAVAIWTYFFISHGGTNKCT